jgi:hypothetical protein
MNVCASFLTALDVWVPCGGRLDFAKLKRLSPPLPQRGHGEKTAVHEPGSKPSHDIVGD